MSTYFHILGKEIPAYGFLIVMGVITANIIVWFLLKHLALDINDFIILEAYSFLGAFIGAKLLYLLISFDTVDWGGGWNLDYFNQLMQSGFVFYGGLIGGLLFAFLAGKTHHINVKKYVNVCIFLIPWIHSFGRIGCFCAGCCYGKEYSGRFSVTFPKNSLAPANVKLFPIQLMEAFALMLLTFVLFLFLKKYKERYLLEIYLVGYAILRFVLEFFRGDLNRGEFGVLSTSQWISIILFVAIIGKFTLQFIREKNISAGYTTILLGNKKNDRKGVNKI